MEKALAKMETDMKQTPVKVSVIQEALLVILGDIQLQSHIFGAERAGSKLSSRKTEPRQFAQLNLCRNQSQVRIDGNGNIGEAAPRLRF